MLWVLEGDELRSDSLVFALQDSVQCLHRSRMSRAGWRQLAAGQAPVPQVSGTVEERLPPPADARGRHQRSRFRTLHFVCDSAFVLPSCGLRSVLGS